MRRKWLSYGFFEYKLTSCESQRDHIRNSNGIFDKKNFRDWLILTKSQLTALHTAEDEVNFGIGTLTLNSRFPYSRELSVSYCPYSKKSSGIMRRKLAFGTETHQIRRHNGFDATALNA